MAQGCHPPLAPAMLRGLTMGAPWEIWKMMHPHSVASACLEAQPCTSMLHLWPRAFPTCLGIGLGAPQQGGTQDSPSRRLTGKSQLWWDICSSEAGLGVRLPFPGCRVGRAADLQCPGMPSTGAPSTAAPKMLLPRSFKRHLKAPLNSCGPSALWNYT